MVFDYTFNIWDIIWLLSLVVWIISLFFIKPIYNHFHINNHQNLWNVVINWWKPFLNQIIVQNIKISNKEENLSNTNKSNEW